jgi:hypothetical protein
VRGRGDAGQASILAIASVVVALLGIVIVARVAAAAVQQSRAQHAADAAALAGVRSGRSGAAALAAANHAELVSYQRLAGRAGGSVRVVVVVRYGERLARATAEGDSARRDEPRQHGRGGTRGPPAVLYARGDA